MRIAYFNATLTVGQDDVTRCVYKMIYGALERGHQAIAITSSHITGQTSIPIYSVPSVMLPCIAQNYGWEKILDQLFTVMRK